MWFLSNIVAGDKMDCNFVVKMGFIDDLLDFMQTNDDLLLN